MNFKKFLRISTNFKSKSKAFTLIEMLIVITIIALLAGLILRGLGGALPKTRDSKRIGDLKNVQGSLELYYANKSSYPNVSTWSGLETELKTVLGQNVKLPQDPSGGTNTYYYCPGSASSSGAINSYTLGAQLEITGSTDSLTGMTCGKSCGVSNFYCVGM
jgi:prepilin-type N-terminal cleavage/methylation domain-containing protein